MTKTKKVQIEEGDEVMFGKMPTLGGVLCNGWYKVEGFTEDFQGRQFAVIAGLPQGSPTCWPVSKFAYVRKGAR